MPAKTEVTEQDWGAPQQPHSGDVLGACPHPPPVLRCLWEVASSCRVGGGCSASSQQPPPYPSPPHPVSPFLEQSSLESRKKGHAKKGRMPWEAAGLHLPPPSPGSPSGWPHPGAAPEAPSPSGSHGPPQPPPGSAGLPSCRWMARTGCRDYRSNDLPKDTG